MNTTSRRSLLVGLGSMALLSGLKAGEPPAQRKGPIKQVISAWPFLKGAGWTLEQLIAHAKNLGLDGVELLSAEELPLLKGTGLVCAATRTHSFVRGMNNKGHHPECFALLEKAILATSEAGFPNVMTFTGFADTSNEKNGSVVSLEEGTRNCIEGYKTMARLAEKHKVTMVLESLNSRATGLMKGHPGYQGDHIDYCVEIVRAVGSPAIKALFDAYHVQIMDGDLVNRIHQHKEFIAHVQVAGNPGRNEIGAHQEINYRAVMEALLAINYQGYVAHEWIPTGDPLVGLREAIAICNVFTR